MTAAAVQTSESSLVARARGLGLTCGPAASKDDPPIHYTLCRGEIPSWDGLRLATVLAFPEGANGPLPTVLWLHGGSSDGLEFITQAANECCSPPHYHWNVPWFVSQGYAAIAYTARGFGDSCGPGDPDPDCALNKRWTHIAERGFEGRDSQHLLGVAVDASIADPDRLAATGVSYGGGQTWLLATSLPWDTPAPGERKIRLAAAVPFAGWTDVWTFLAPNGRASDRLDRPDSHELPIGVFREGWVDEFRGVFLGRRMNTQDPGEKHSFWDGWSAFFHKGEPYDTPEGKALALALRGKSAYYADDFLAGVKGRAVPAVPVFAATEWKDTLFGPPQTLQMYRKLKEADPGYPIWMAFGDYGLHVGDDNTGDNPDEQGLAIGIRYTVDQANRFLDAFVRGVGPPPVEKVFSYRQECPNPTAPDRVGAPKWDLMTGDTLVLSDPGARTTTSTSANPEEEADVGAKTVAFFRCITLGPATPGSPSARWTWPVREGFTLVGLPRLKVSYALSGPVIDATVVTKVWDVAPDDPTTLDREDIRTLVDRGVYRLAATGGDLAAGVLSFELFGNHWRFAAGHSLQLELSQTDAPLFRPDNFASSVVFSSPQLTLPLATDR